MTDLERDVLTELETISPGTIAYALYRERFTFLVPAQREPAESAA